MRLDARRRRRRRRRRRSVQNKRDVRGRREATVTALQRRTGNRVTFNNVSDRTIGLTD